MDQITNDEISVLEVEKVQYYLFQRDARPYIKLITSLLKLEYKNYINNIFFNIILF